MYCFDFLGGLVVVMTSDGAFGLSLKDGSQKWDITLTDRSVSDYRKNCKNQDTENVDCNCPKKQTVYLIHAVMPSNDADRMTNSIDLDQTAPFKEQSDLVLHCLLRPVCPNS